MGDSVAGSAAWLGGTEIVNDQRTLAYLTQCEDFNLQVTGDCACNLIRELAGCDGEPYRTPELDNAPWYDPLIPESANFAGFLVSDFNGLSSTFTRDIAETVSDGGVLGRSRLASRSLTWKGFLFGSTCCAVAYGLRWLGKTLQGSKQCGNNCFGDDLEILVCCPSVEEAQGIGTNLMVCNPDFDDNVGYWLGTGDTVISWVTYPFYSFTGALSSANAVGGAITFSNVCPIPVTGNTSYKFATQIRGATGSDSEILGVTFNWFDADSNFISSTISSDLGSDNDSDWSSRSSTIVSPLTAAFVEIDFIIGDVLTPAGQTHLIDDVSFSEVLTTTPIDPFRTMKGVGLLEGPIVVNERGGGCGCGASCITEIEFTIGSPQPYLYGTPIPVVDCVDIISNSVPIVSFSEDDCPPINCIDLYLPLIENFDPDCVIGDLPPVQTYTNTCLGGPLDGYNALYISVPRSYWNSISEVVPVITIQTGGLYIINPRIGFYSSPDDNPCGDLLNNPPTCDVICDTLRISILPANSKFYIDGRTRQMSLVCGTNAVFPGEPYTLGPFAWPSFDCFGFCMEFAYDPAFLSPGSCVSLSLVPRTTL